MVGNQAPIGGRRFVLLCYGGLMYFLDVHVGWCNAINFNFVIFSRVTGVIKFLIILQKFHDSFRSIEPLEHSCLIELHSLRILS